MKNNIYNNIYITLEELLDSIIELISIQINSFTFDTTGNRSD